MSWTLRSALVATLALLTPAASAATVKAQVALSSPAGPGAGIGTVTFTDTPNGAHIQVSLHDLPPGTNGFDVHANGDCGPGFLVHPGPEGDAMTPVAAGAAGQGYEAGDLPSLTVQSNGRDSETLTAPQISDVSRLKDRSVVIREAGSDVRLACGVIR